MIPEEVAEIATLLRNEYYIGDDTDADFQHSISVAWKIYNIKQAYEKAHKDLINGSQ